MKILERSYDVHITFATDSLRDFRFYGSFGRGEQGIRDILEALEKTGKVHYIQDEQEITLYKPFVKHTKTLKLCRMWILNLAFGERT